MGLRKVNIYIIIIHCLFWALFISSPLLFFFKVNFNLFLKPQFYILHSFIIGVFYTNYYLLIPHLFFRKKFVLYFISIIALLAINVYFVNQIEGDFFGHPPYIGEEALEKLGLINDFKPHGKPQFSTVFSIILIAVGSCVRITSQWLHEEKEKTAIKKEKISAELSFLKSQIDPHFFFNTLNNIYSLAQLKSDKAPQTILKLSELMRYNIYDADKETVLLKDEINYIQNFIDLQRIRLAKSVDIDFYVMGEIGEKEIEPLLFLPFIENAFKHGIDYANNCSIDIEIVVEETEISLLVINSVLKGERRSSSHSGVGLSNIHKRLELLYKNRHTLTIAENEKRFMVKLKLDIDEN